MSTTEYIIPDTGYVLVSEEDCEIQNNSSYIVRLVYGNYVPSLDESNFHRLSPNQYRIFKISDLPEGKIYALCENKNQKSRVVASTGMFNSNINAEINLAIAQLLLELKHLRAITQETYQSDITKEDIISDEC